MFWPIGQIVKKGKVNVYTGVNGKIISCATHMYTTQNNLRILKILNFLCTSYMLCVHVWHNLYINYTKKLRIFNILNLFCVVRVEHSLLYIETDETLGPTVHVRVICRILFVQFSIQKVNHDLF